MCVAQDMGVATDMMTAAVGIARTETTCMATTSMVMVMPPTTPGYPKTPIRPTTNISSLHMGLTMGAPTISLGGMVSRTSTALHPTMGLTHRLH